MVYYPRYKTELHVVVKQKSWSCGERVLFYCSLHSSSLCGTPVLGVPVNVTPMGQIDMFSNLLGIIIISYLKPEYCAKIIYITYEYLVTRIANIQ